MILLDLIFGAIILIVFGIFFDWILTLLWFHQYTMLSWKETFLTGSMFWWDMNFTDRYKYL